MPNFVVIFLCMGLGLLARRMPKFPAVTGSVLGSFIINVALPAVILVQIPEFFKATSPTASSQVGSEPLWLPIAMSWGVFAFSFLIFAGLGNRLDWSRKKTGALILTAGLGNTSFVGFPMLEALLGKESLRIGILADQPGSFLVLSLPGLIVATLYAGAKLDVRALLRRIVLFPPLVTLIVAAIWGAAGSPGETLFAPALGKIAATLIPLALFSVGFQLRLDRVVLKREWPALSLGLLYKMCLAPLFVFLICFFWIGVNNVPVQATILESGMAPMITAAVVASELELDRELANLMVGVGIPLSLATVSVWFLFLKLF